MTQPGRTAPCLRGECGGVAAVPPRVLHSCPLPLTSGYPSERARSYCVTEGPDSVTKSHKGVSCSLTCILGSWGPWLSLLSLRAPGGQRVCHLGAAGCDTVTRTDGEVLWERECLCSHFSGQRKCRTGQCHLCQEDSHSVGEQQPPHPARASYSSDRYLLSRF